MAFWSRALKGSDLVLYSVFKSLSIEVNILPVVGIEGDYHAENPELGIEGRSRSGYYDEYDGYGYGSRSSETYDEMSKQGFGKCDDVDSRWKVLLIERSINSMIAQGAPMEGLARVGTRLQPYKVTDWMLDEGKNADEVSTSPQSDFSLSLSLSLRRDLAKFVSNSSQGAYGHSTTFRTSPGSRN